MSKPEPRLIGEKTLSEMIVSHYERETDLHDHYQGHEIAVMQVCAMIEDDIQAGDAVADDSQIRATIRNYSNSWRGDKETALHFSQKVANDIQDLLEAHPLVNSGDVSALVRVRAMAGIMNACDTEIQSCSRKQYVGMLASAVAQFLKSAEVEEFLMFWEMVSHCLPQDGDTFRSSEEVIRAIYGSRDKQ